jgi:uncharacterized protein (TIGR02271 family)
MGYEKIVTLFDTAEHAETAKHNLELAGFPASEISVTSKNALGVGGETLREPGLWHKLFGGNIEEHEATVYGNTVDAGGVVLTARVPDADVPKAMGILNAHQSVDVTHRAVERGFVDAKTVAPKATANAPLTPSVAPAKALADAKAAVSSGNRDEVLRLAEEQLEVGKRLVEQGTTRIRRFVTEKPVEQNVTLHEEHAEVVRRAAADPSVLDDVDWGEKTIEVRETAEEAVVKKTAHIAEEVVISKTGSEHVETIHDTVRRQQVEVEKIPGKGVEKTQKV